MERQSDGPTEGPTDAGADLWMDAQTILQGCEDASINAGCICWPALASFFYEITTETPTLDSYQTAGSILILVRVAPSHLALYFGHLICQKMSRNSCNMASCITSPTNKIIKAGYTAISRVRVGRGSNAQKSTKKRFLQKRCGPMDQRTNGPTDQWTNGTTDGHTLL